MPARNQTVRAGLAAGSTELRQKQETATARISEQITGRWKSNTAQHNTIAFQIKHIDLRAYKSLRGSPLAMDIYT